jgi:protein-S-isoprenylcysteine O-methyltransferase Ste14
MLVIIALTIHHKIILAEEVSMEYRFGTEWVEYRNKVPRYI